MADPLSVAGSVCGIVSLGIGACKGIVEFYQSYTNQEATVSKTTRSCKDLLSVLELLDAFLKDQKFKPGDEDLVLKVEESILACKESIDELLEELKKLDGAGLKRQARKLWYPLKESTLLKLRESIQEARDNAAFVVECLELKAQAAISQDIQDISSLLASINTSTIQGEIKSWLRAPDPTINLNSALEKRHEGTGSWLLESSELKRWSSRSSSVIWVNGFAGCGKTVLCSTVIHQALLETQATAFYFFDFRDVEKQTAHHMLRSVVLQLAGQSPAALSLLEDLWRHRRLGEPTTEILFPILRDMIAEFKDVRIFLDALDEIPRGDARNSAFRMLKRIRDWKLPQLHLFITSRAEQDITEGLALPDGEVLAVKNRHVDEDIREYVRDRLRSEPKLEKWSSEFPRIEQALTDGANGMFRWVECQFVAISSCRTRKKLNEALEALPKSLDETYERMLSSIEEDSVEEAHRLLTWLCFSARPLKITEVVEALAISFDEEPKYEEDDRLLEANDVLDICPGFVILDKPFYDRPEDAWLRLAHFSIKEYLMSTRIASDFYMNSTVANTMLAKCCVSYLLRCNSIENIDGIRSRLEASRHHRSTVESFVLGKYAAEEWSSHCWQAEDSKVLWRMVSDLAIAPGAPLRALQWYYNRWGYSWPTSSPSPTFQPADPLLFYGAFWGLTHVVSSALNRASEINSAGIHYDVISGWCEYPYRLSVLGAAAYGNHLEIVRMLLDHGADPNYAPPGGPSALLMACRYRSLGEDSSSNIDVVQHLLNSGADINNYGHTPVDPQDLVPKTPLSIAMYHNSLELGKLLVSHGASVHEANPIDMRQPLHYASSQGNLGAVSFLLQNDAAKEARDKDGATPYLSIDRAFRSRRDGESLLTALHYPGAIHDVDNKGKTLLHRTAETSSNGEFVLTLLAKGADKTVRDNHGRSPFLCAANERCNLDVLKPLACPGAIAETDLDGRNALHKILGFYFDLELHFRASLDLCKTLYWLLEEGCSTTTCDESGYLACHYAAKDLRCIPLLQILMDHEREINISEVDPAVLLLTTYSGGTESLDVHRRAVTCLSLLEETCEIDIDLLAANLTGDSPTEDSGIRYGTICLPYEELHDGSLPSHDSSFHKLVWCIALRAAARQNRWDVVRSLRSENGIDAAYVVLDAAAFYGISLDDVESTFGPQKPQAHLVLSAASRGHLEMLKSLEERGAALDCRDSNGDNTLSLAIMSGHVDVARFLDTKVDFEASSKCMSIGLEYAAKLGEVEVLRFLSSKGFDIQKCIFPFGWSDPPPYQTALHLAARYNRVSFVEALLKLGHPVDALDDNGYYPLVRACTFGYTKMVQLLLESGAQASPPCVDDIDPLSAACKGGHVDTVKVLVESGVDLTRQYSGRTILEACDMWVDEGRQREFDEMCNLEGRQAVFQYLQAYLGSV